MNRDKNTKHAIRDANVADSESDCSGTGMLDTSASADSDEEIVDSEEEVLPI